MDLGFGSPRRELVSVELPTIVDFAGSNWRKVQKMSTETREILDRAMELPAVEKARLVDQLVSSLDEPDEAIDACWRKEVEDRIHAYQAGTLKSVSLSDFLAKYRT